LVRGVVAAPRSLYESTGRARAAEITEGIVMQKSTAWGLVALLAVSLWPAVAAAHPTGAAGAGLAAGFAHPLGGLDHLLAMVAVGLWAAQLGGRALWLVPLGFVGALLLGGLAAFSGPALPIVEPGIAGSLLVLGGLIALRQSLPPWLGGLVVGLFALCHGHAHGSELPAGAAPLLYVLGFVAATALLHLAGIGLGRGLAGRLVLRAGGAGIATAGLWFLVV